MNLPYLARLLLRLSTGLERIAPERRARHIEFLSSMQQSDGGFSGRQGGSDLYYTSFALRGLAVLGALDHGIAMPVANFLRLRMQAQVPLIDLISLVFSAQLLESAVGIDLFAESKAAWPDNLTDLFGQLRCTDGGYARSTEGKAGSTYQTFLIALIHQQLDKPLPEPQRVADFVHSQHRDDGGYVEIRVMRHSGTNPTAAAIGTLETLTSWLNPNDTGNRTAVEPVASFLSSMQIHTGGFRANTRIPLADLLSTYTGLQALGDLDQLSLARIDRAECYLASLEQPGGGWHAAEWDDTIDVEYTFYGLAALGLVLGAR